MAGLFIAHGFEIRGHQPPDMFIAWDRRPDGSPGWSISSYHGCTADDLAHLSSFWMISKQVFEKKIPVANYTLDVFCFDLIICRLIAFSPL